MKLDKYALYTILMLILISVVPLIPTYIRSISILPSATMPTLMAMMLDIVASIIIVVLFTKNPLISMWLSFALGIICGIFSAIEFALVLGSHIGLSIGVYAYVVAIIAGIIFSMTIAFFFGQAGHGAFPTPLWFKIKEIAKEKSPLTPEALGWPDKRSIRKLIESYNKKLAEKKT